MEKKKQQSKTIEHRNALRISNYTSAVPIPPYLAKKFNVRAKHAVLIWEEGDHICIKGEGINNNLSVIDWVPDKIRYLIEQGFETNTDIATELGMTEISVAKLRKKYRLYCKKLQGDGYGVLDAEPG